MYYFGPLDTKLEDRFIKGFPVCYQDEPHGRRRWYGKVVSHAVAHGMYIHDPFCFRTLSITQQNQQSERRGFTCDTEADDEQFDLPEQFSAALTRWSSKICQAVNNPGIFPNGGPSEVILQSSLHTDGYALLLKIIYEDIPAYADYPACLLGSRPKQEPGKTIQQYYDITIGWLQLRAKILNKSDNLNNRDEMDLFINGLYSSKDFFTNTHNDRNSPLPAIQGKYQQNAIVGTLNAIAKRMNIKAQSPAPRIRSPSTLSLSTPLARMAFP